MILLFPPLILTALNKNHRLLKATKLIALLIYIFTLFQVLDHCLAVQNACAFDFETHVQRS